MMKKKVWKAIGGVLGGILLLALVLVLYYRDCANAVLWNALSKKIPMDISQEWEGGTSYLKVPYSDVSESDYVDIYVPSDVENPPLMVIVHGGGFVSNDSQSRQAQKMYRYFRDHGYACATVNYRLAQEAAYPAALCDVKACIRFLKGHASEYGYSTDQISIFGESAGGYLATAAAVSGGEAFTELPVIGEENFAEPVDASVNVLIDFYGACYFREAHDLWDEMKYPQVVISIANSWLKIDELDGYTDVHSYWLRENADEMSEEAYHEISMDGMMEKGVAKDPSLRVYISHGDCDITVPIGISSMFADRVSAYLGEDQVLFHVVPKAGHAADIMYSDKELAAIDAFLRAE